MFNDHSQVEENKDEKVTFAPNFERTRKILQNSIKNEKKRQPLKVWLEI